MANESDRAVYPASPSRARFALLKPNFLIEYLNTKNLLRNKRVNDLILILSSRESNPSPEEQSNPSCRFHFFVKKKISSSFHDLSGGSIPFPPPRWLFFGIPRRPPLIDSPLIKRPRRNVAVARGGGGEYGESIEEQETAAIGEIRRQPSTSISPVRGPASLEDGCSA